MHTRLMDFAGVVVLAATAVAAAANGDSTETSQPIIPMVQCAGCSGGQMKVFAAQHHAPGLILIYDYATNTVRKYNRYLDSTCRPDADPADSQAVDAAADDRSPASAQPPGCNPVWEADEMSPVDPIIVNAFNTMRSVRAVNPGLISTGVARVPIGILGPAPGGTDNYDPPVLAAGYPDNLGYNGFKIEVDHMLSTIGLANQLSNGLGDLLYGIGFTFQQIVELTGLEVTGVTGKVTFDFRAATQITLQFANPEGDYVQIVITPNADGTISWAFDGAYDANYNRYPQQDSTLPRTPQWRWPGGPGANGNGDHFGQGLQHQGYDGIPVAPLCGTGRSLWLFSQWEGHRLIGTYFSCI